jgi:hypothetical protein
LRPFLRITYARERDTKTYVRFIPPEDAPVVGAILVRKTDPLSNAPALVVELTAGG